MAVLGTDLKLDPTHEDAWRKYGREDPVIAEFVSRHGGRSSVVIDSIDLSSDGGAFIHVISFLRPVLMQVKSVEQPEIISQSRILGSLSYCPSSRLHHLSRL